MLGKDLNLNYKRLRALCVHGEGGTPSFSDFAGNVRCLVVCVCGCSHAAEGDTA